MGTEMKKFKVCYFKLKINHDGKGLEGMVFFLRSYLQQELILVFVGRVGWANCQASRSPFTAPHL